MAVASTIPAGWKGLPSFVLAEAGVSRGHDGEVLIPYRDALGRLYVTRVVVKDGHRWWRPAGRAVIPFGLDRLADTSDRRFRCLLITEGESDALAAWAAFGHEGLDVLGVPGATTWRQEWTELAEGYAAVYVAGDGDGVGRRFAWTVKRDLPGAVVLEIPEGLDVRDVIQREGEEAFGVLLEQADAWERFERAFFESQTFEELERRLRGQTANALIAPKSRVAGGSTRLPPERVITGLQPAQRAA